MFFLLKFFYKFYRDENEGITIAVKEGKKKKNRSKHQKNKAKENRRKAMVESISVIGSTQSDTYILVDTVDCLRSDCLPGYCLRCGELARKICDKCQKNSNQISYYCSKECWAEHLSIHEQICSLDMPTKKFLDNSIYSSIFQTFFSTKTKKEGIGRTS